MAITRVASPAFASGSSGGTTGAIDTTGATLIVVAVVAYNSGFATALTDSKSNTWTALTTYTYTGGQNHITLYYCASPTVGSGHTFKIASTAASYSACVAQAYAGTSASPFDQGAGSADGANHNQAGSITPSFDNCLMISAMGVCSGNGTDSVDSSFTAQKLITYSGGNNYGLDFGDQIQTTKTARNPTWTTTAGTYGPTVLASFLPSGSSVTVTAVVCAATAAAPAPTVKIPKTVTAVVCAATAALPAPAVTANTKVSAAVCAATAALPAPTVLIPGTVTAVVCPATAAAPAPTVKHTVIAAVCAAVAAFPAPAAGTLTKINAVACAATAALPAPIVQADTAVIAVPCVATADFPAPSTESTVVIEAAVCSAIAGFHGPVVSITVPRYPNAFREFTPAGYASAFRPPVTSGNPSAFRPADPPPGSPSPFRPSD